MEWLKKGKYSSSIHFCGGTRCARVVRRISLSQTLKTILFLYRRHDQFMVAQTTHSNASQAPGLVSFNMTDRGIVEPIELVQRYRCDRHHHKFTIKSNSITLIKASSWGRSTSQTAESPNGRFSFPLIPSHRCSKSILYVLEWQYNTSKWISPMHLSSSQLWKD